MFDLTAKTALVTGAGQGVGAEIARVLVDAGASVYVNDVVPERAGAVASTIGATALPFDITDRSAVEHAVSGADAIDILINNAGIPASMRLRQFRDLSPEEWRPYIDVNLYGVLNCVKATIDGMCEREWGRIITISSAAGSIGMRAGLSVYGAGKAAAIGFMRNLALECARMGVTANTLVLGTMASPDTHSEGSPLVEKWAATIPVGRPGTGADVGYACAFLASEEAAWITGQTIGVNGGAITS